MITDEQVMEYIAGCAESVIEDDLNEDGEWTDEEHEELINRAMEWISDHR